MSEPILRREEPPRQLVARQWEPIETAPKDGTPVDLWARGVRQTGATWQADWREWRTSSGRIAYDVTHWMPLPPPPDPLGVRAAAAPATPENRIHLTRDDYGAARELAEADRYLDAVGAPVSSPSGEVYSVSGRIVSYQAIYAERIKAAQEPTAAAFAPQVHFCAGCHHQWTDESVGGEHCGDCHRVLIAALSANRAATPPGETAARRDPQAFHRYTITSEGASKGYFRLIEDPEGAWVTWAEVAANFTALALSGAASQEPTID